LKIRVLAILIIALGFAGNAQAYLDPGSGSMLLQVILGGIAAVGVALKLAWHKIVIFFGRGKKKAAAAEEADS
jgi:hypothetical protein